MTENRGKILTLEVAEEHSSAGLAAEATDFAKAHGPEDLDNLGVPGTKHIDDSLAAPVELDCVNPDGTRLSAATIQTDAALIGQQYGYIHGGYVGAANHDLGYVLGQSDSTGNDQAEAIAQAGADQSLVDLGNSVANKARLGGGL